MNETEVAHRRRGGRDARRELRAAPIPEAKRAVKPGMEGGDYKPLSEAEVERIHHAALDVLEQVGFSDAIPSCIELFTDAGATLTDEGRILVPRALVEDTLANANRSVTLHSRDGKADLQLSGNRVHYGTAGAAVSMVDVEGREYRDSTVQDLHDAARICEKLENIHFVQRPMVCRDISDNLDMGHNFYKLDIYLWYP